MSNSGGPPPLPNRRARVREVPSRFMSPAPSPSSSTNDLHYLTMKSPKHSISTPASSDRQPPEPFSSNSQENIPETTRRSMETPFQFTKPESVTRRHQQQRKLFKENGFGDQIQISKSSTVRTSKSSRPDTPTDRIVQSRYKLPQQRQSSQSTSSETEAAKLLQLSFSSSNNNNNNQSESIQGGSCPNSPISSRTSASVTSCSRSLNLPTSGSLNSFKSIDRTLCRPSPALPPQPACTKPGVDGKKGKKPQSSQQDVHSLKVLHNHYLQWRFANAKAQASMHAQKTEMENQFFSLGVDISNLRDNVKKKQAELAILQRAKALTTILHTQMPYLDEWSAVEEDYTRSLSGAITALTNSSLRLPISGNVQVNVKEAADAMDSAVKTADMIVQQMQMFLPKAEEMDSLMSELATVIDVEKALVEECGSLLAKTHTLQVEDCSLRGHLMQVASS